MCEKQSNKWEMECANSTFEQLMCSTDSELSDTESAADRVLKLSTNDVWLNTQSQRHSTYNDINSSLLSGVFKRNESCIATPDTDVITSSSSTSYSYSGSDDLFPDLEEQERVENFQHLEKVRKESLSSICNLKEKLDALEEYILTVNCPRNITLVTDFVNNVCGDIKL